MANTFTQIYLQFVFATQGRENVIPKKNKEEIHKYITGIVQKRKSNLLAVNCMPDHTHLFIGYKPVISIPDLVQEVKVASNKFINQKFVYGNFKWQSGYGAFSYSQSHIDRVIRYIKNQESHHERKTFKSEYLSLLNKFEIEFADEYLFDFYE